MHWCASLAEAGVAFVPRVKRGSWGKLLSPRGYANGRRRPRNPRKSRFPVPCMDTLHRLSLFRRQCRNWLAKRMIARGFFAPPENPTRRRVGHSCPRIVARGLGTGRHPNAPTTEKRRHGLALPRIRRKSFRPLWPLGEPWVRILPQQPSSSTSVSYPNRPGPPRDFSRSIPIWEWSMRRLTAKTLRHGKGRGPLHGFRVPALIPVARIPH